MAYKFQVGPAQLSGALTQEGTIEVRDPNTGVLVAHATDAGEISASADLKAGGGLDVEGNADIEGTLDAAGAVSLAATTVLTDIRGTLSVDEAATFDANVTILGDTQIGNNNADAITFNAQVDSNFVSDGSSRNLGASALPWEKLYVNEIDASELSGTLQFGLEVHSTGGLAIDVRYDNAEESKVSLANASAFTDAKILRWDGSGYQFENSNIEDDGSLVTIAVNLTASGDLTLTGDAFLDSNADIGGNGTVGGTLGVTGVATFTAGLTASADSEMQGIMPAANLTHDLGASGLEWNELYVGSIVATAIDAQQLSGALQFGLEAHATGGLAIDARYDNVEESRISLKNASSFADEKVLRWNNTNNEFENSSISDDGSVVIVDAALSASGRLDIDGAAAIDSDLSVGGDFSAEGNLTFGSSAAQDVVVYQAAVSSSVFPSHTDSWDLGSSSKRWDQIYAREVRADSFVGNIAFDIQRDNGTFAAETDLYIVTGSASAVTLPSGDQGKVIRIKRDSTSTADVTLSPASGESFDDGSPIILETAGAAITCVFDGAAGSGIWYII